MKRHITRHPKRRQTVGLIGLGYVGLPLACLASEKGFKVVGFERKDEKVALINKQKSPFVDAKLSRWLKRVSIEATTDSSRLKECHIVIICVPTPVDHLYNPDLGPVRDAVNMVRRYGRKSVLVILESTVNPGVSEEVVMPILTQGGRREGRDFLLAHCPERINPGDPKWSVRNIPRVVGGVSTKALNLAVKFYEVILEAAVKPMGSIKAAEATKILENSFRDVNIAFINEIAKSFTYLGIDVLDVIEGAKTKPFAFMAHYPSCGVGGHCIPVDPYYLIERAKLSGFDHKFLKLAREINNSMPAYTVDLLIEGLNDIRKSVRGTSVAVLGVAYKADVGDVRESPAIKIISLLRELGADVKVFDPHIQKLSTVPTLQTALKNSVAVIIVTNHKEFTALRPSEFQRAGIKLIVDGKNCLDQDAIRDKGIIYKGIGR